MNDQKNFKHSIGRVIRDEIETTATPQQAWQAWAEPDKIAHWFVDRASGNPTPGEIITWFWDDMGFSVPYEVVDAIPGKHFVIKFVPPEGDPGILEITITHHDGQTQIHLVNSGFGDGSEWDDEYVGVVSGWRLALCRLKYYLENHFGQPKKSFLAMRPAQFEYDDLLPYYHDENCLSHWLTTAGTIGDPGQPYQLTLQNGDILRGHVLTLTSREIALSAPGLNAVIELKAFSMGHTRTIAIGCTTWGLDADRFTRLTQTMNVALDHLLPLVNKSDP